MTSPNRRNPRAQWVLPTEVNPTDTVCFKVDVPNEPMYIAAFRGALLNLCSAQQWQNDLAHTALLVASRWRDVYESVIKQSSCDDDCATVVAESDYEMSICEQLRFNPATGHLQAFCCGAWTDISGQPAQGIGGPGQPGSGSPQPAPNGGCVTYHAIMNAGDQWLAPAPVSAGDTVQVSNMQGAWSDGAGLWYCLNGQVFFAGACTIPARDALDPIPGAGHMALLSKIAGTFTDVSGGGVFTVPGGVSNALLIFQPNDHNPAAAFGQVTFDVTVCNNQAGTFTHTWDFTAAPGAWVHNGADNSIWAAGSGWSAGTHGTTTGVQLNLPHASRTINTITITFTVTSPTATATWDVDVILPGSVTLASGVPVAGVNTRGNGGAPVPTTSTEVLITAFSNHGTAGAGGNVVMTKCVITGVGVDPF